ncbi:MAG: hypothetical protein JXX28_12815 [Deltaproteobacteria bacterium]|nr:hypothetical protein [Deltaproteobacteria bacterium]
MPAFRDLLDLALPKGWSEDTEVRGIADGVRYVRRRLEDEFSAVKFRFILEWPHCREHLTEAGEALGKLTGTPAQEWARAAMSRLEAGEVASVVAELRATWERSGPDEPSRDDAQRLAAW